MARMYDMDTVNRAMMEAARYYKPGKKSSKKVAKVLECFARMRAVEVETIPKGEWLKCSGVPRGMKDAAAFRECSNCLAPNKYQYDYCPRCGAKMDGGASDG